MRAKKVYRVIGLMSGTSLDGVDAALIETDGYDYVKPLDFLYTPYDDETRAKIRPAYGKTDRDDPAVKLAEGVMTRAHVKAVQKLQAKHADIDLIGFHGQTIYHAPSKTRTAGDGLTIQIGDGALLASETGIDVVCDMRSADVQAGGEGAPLAPLYHRARVVSSDLEMPLVILNIGGVGNVTWIGSSSRFPRESGDLKSREQVPAYAETAEVCGLLAFDTGPGNALMDDFVQKNTGARFDTDGAMAAKGQVNEALLEAWLAQPYFAKEPPKSLDRDEWDIAALGPLVEQNDMSVEDGLATLQAFTVRSIVNAAAFMPEPPVAWYACGGGRLNKGMMDNLSKALSKAGLGDLHDVSALGWDGDATEAECFAYLAVRSLLKEPLSLPTTTGVKDPLTGGKIYLS